MNMDGEGRTAVVGWPCGHGGVDRRGEIKTDTVGSSHPTALQKNTLLHFPAPAELFEKKKTDAGPPPRTHNTDGYACHSHSSSLLLSSYSYMHGKG